MLFFDSLPSLHWLECVYCGLLPLLNYAPCMWAATGATRQECRMSHLIGDAKTAPLGATVTDLHDVQTR
jgi:hypothetical protein